jgi:integrase
LGISEVSVEEIYSWVESYVSSRTHRKLGPHGKNNYIIAVKWLLKRSELIELSLEEMNKLKKYKTEPSGQVIEEGEFYRLLSYSPDRRFELAYLLMFETGVRPHELLSIRISDVKVQPSGLILIKIPEQNPVIPSKHNKTGSRTIVVKENAAQISSYVNSLTEKEHKADKTLLFPFHHKQLSAVFCRMKRQQRSEAAPSDRVFTARLYDLRHTAITRYYLQDLPDQVIRKLVGWSPSSKMPDVYVHIKIDYITQSYSDLKELEGII